MVLKKVALDFSDGCGLRLNQLLCSVLFFVFFFFWIFLLSHLSFFSSWFPLSSVLSLAFVGKDEEDEE